MTSESSISIAPSNGAAENMGAMDTRTDALTTLNSLSVFDLDFLDVFSFLNFLVFFAKPSFELPAVGDSSCFRFFDGDDVSTDILGRCTRGVVTVKIGTRRARAAAHKPPSSSQRSLNRRSLPFVPPLSLPSLPPVPLFMVRGLKDNICVRLIPVCSRFQKQSFK